MSLGQAVPAARKKTLFHLALDSISQFTAGALNIASDFVLCFLQFPRNERIKQTPQPVESQPLFYRPWRGNWNNITVVQKIIGKSHGIISVRKRRVVGSACRTGCPARKDQSAADLWRDATGVRAGVLSSITALMKISGNQNSIGMTLSLKLRKIGNLQQNPE